MNYNILCVDDVENNIFILESLFKKYKEFNLFSALSGKEAFDILLKEEIDLVLLDIMMPEMDGFEVAKLMKQNIMTKDIPIIFVTAKTDEESIKEAFENGGVDYITKPYKNYELLARVTMHLDLYIAHKSLVEKQHLLENILDQQQNLIIMTDSKNITTANQSFLRFFHLTKLSEFQSEKKSLVELFVKDSEYYNLGDLAENKNWLNAISINKDKDFITVMHDPNTKESHSFLLKATKIKNEELYIVTFTDITHTVTASKKLEKKAFHDNLTGLYNREKLNEFLTFEMNISSRYESPLSIILFDIDNFKAVNDTYGHISGDHVLRQLALLAQNNIRKTDIVARWGGEEFLVVAPSTALNSAKIIAENIRRTISEDNFPEVGQITCSFGVTSYIINESAEELFKRVDIALYDAKSSGKNIVCSK